MSSSLAPAPAARTTSTRVCLSSLYGCINERAILTKTGLESVEKKFGVEGKLEGHNEQITDGAREQFEKYTGYGDFWPICCGEWD